MKLDLYILIVTIVTVAVGLLLGLMRGSRRAVCVYCWYFCAW